MALGEGHYHNKEEGFRVYGKAGLSMAPVLVPCWSLAEITLGPYKVGQDFLFLERPILLQ
jgi:hypothetical protein